MCTALAETNKACVDRIRRPPADVALRCRSLGSGSACLSGTADGPVGDERSSPSEQRVFQPSPKQIHLLLVVGFLVGRMSALYLRYLVLEYSPRSRWPVRLV